MAAIFSKCVCISFISLPCVNLQPLVTNVCRDVKTTSMDFVGVPVLSNPSPPNQA